MKNKIVWFVLIVPLLVVACLQESVTSSPTATVSPIVAVAAAVLDPASPVATMSDQLGDYVVCVGSVNVRHVPAAVDGVVMWLTPGTMVYVSEVRGDWGRISYDWADKPLWVNMLYLCKMRSEP
jgi:hypothetical protein